jgi:hypothetical protein
MNSKKNKTYYTILGFGRFIMNYRSQRGLRPYKEKTSSYCCHLERGGGKRGEFDNSVRKIQHQGNKTCYKPLCHNL